MSRFRWVFFCILFSSCAVKPANAPKVNIDVPPLENVEKQPFNLQANRIFLWHENVSADEISRVMRIGDEMDRLPKENASLTQEIKDLTGKLKDWSDAKDAKSGKINSNKIDIKDKGKELKKANDGLKKASDDKQKELAKPTPNMDLVHQLEDKIKQFQTQVDTVTADLTRLQNDNIQLQKDLDTLNQDPEMSQGQTHLDALQKKQDINTQKKADGLKEIKTLVDWFEPQPSSISFSFDPNGAVNVTILNWAVDQDEGPRKFSTEPEPGKVPTIQNVKYTVLGGIFEFDVLVFNDDAQKSLREMYSFRVSHSSSTQTDQGYFFVGEVIRTRFLKGIREIRKGQAKLIDQNR